MLLEPADFLEDSLRWAAAVLAGAVTVQRREVDHDEAAWDAACDAARKLVLAKTGGRAPGALRAVELVRAARTATRDEAFAAEDDALGDLIMTDELRAGLYAFDLVQKRAKRPAGAPDKSLARPVTKVGIVGAGLMASQLALLFARRLGVPVVMTDLDEERVAKGVGWVHAEIAGRCSAKRRLSPDKASFLTGLVTGSTTKDGFADADFVIEAVFEEMAVKQQVFAEVEAVVSPECVLATNTSSLSITEMASRLQHPERVVGFHFFNPVAVMPLLEIIPGEATDDAALATAFATGRTLGKTTIRVKDSASFVVNRLLGALHGRVLADRRRGHPGGHRRPGGRRPGPDAAVRAARAGRPGDRAAQQRDAAPGLRRPLLRLAEPAAPRRGRQARLLRDGGRPPGARPRGAGAGRAAGAPGRAHRRAGA